jgi:hypothetical protein
MGPWELRGLHGDATSGRWQPVGPVATANQFRRIITKNGTPVAKITPQAANRTKDPEWRAAFAALEKSLRSKRGIGYRVGTISEDDKYGGTT